MSIFYDNKMESNARKSVNKMIAYKLIVWRKLGVLFYKIWSILCSCTGHEMRNEFMKIY